MVELTNVSVADVFNKQKTGTSSADIYKATKDAGLKNISVKSAFEQAAINDKYKDLKYDDNFWGQTAASYQQGKLSQDSALAWNDYYVNPTQENKVKAQALDRALTQFQTNNTETLANDATLPWISQSAAGYVPQLIGQVGSGIVGAGAAGAAGAAAGSVVPGLGTATGALWGSRAGYVAGSSKYSYDTMRGFAFREMLNLGVPEDVARKVSADEAVLSALIEGADSIIDLATLGAGKLGKIIFKTGTKTAAEKALSQRIVKALAGYGVNIGAEAGQEAAQQVISLTNQDRALEGNTDGNFIDLAGQAVQKAQNLTPEEVEEVKQSAAEGAKIAALLGGVQLAGNTIAANSLQSEKSGNKNIIPSFNGINVAADADVSNPLVQSDVTKAILGSSIGREYVKNTYGNETNFRNAVKEANPQLNDVQAYVVMANEVKSNLANNTYTDKNAVKEQTRIAKLPQLPSFTQQTEGQDIRYFIVPEGNKKIVVVDNPDVSTKLSDTEKEMLSLFKNLTGENAVISESDNSRISVNRRAVQEFLRSDYVQTLSKDLKNVVYVTGRQLDELIKASEPALSYENTDPKHTKDASLGWEHREVIFESPVTKNGKTQWKRFNAMLIVRKNNMGNYSHGIIGIQKKGPAAYGMAHNEAAIKSAEPSFDTKISQKSDGVNRNFMQNGENNTQRSEENYDDLHDEGRSNRSVGERAGEQTGSIQETSGSSTQRRAEAQPAGKENRSGNDGNVSEDRKRVTIRNKISIAPVMLKEETQEMSDIRKRAKELGLKDVVFMYGYGTDLKTNEEFRGAYDSESKTVYIQVDNSEATIEQIFQHESYHYAVDKNPKLVRETIAKIRKLYPDNQELQSIYDLYADAYASIYGNSKYKIFEEVLADAYAGLNSFTGSEIVAEIAAYTRDTAQNVAATTDDVKLSISPDLSAELQKVLDGTFNSASNEVYIGETSNFMTDVIEAELLSVYMPASKAYGAMVSEEKAKKDGFPYKNIEHYHNLGKDRLIEILDASETPVLAFAAPSDYEGNKRENRIVLVTDKKVGNENAIVIEEVDTTALKSGKRIKANKIITTYNKNSLQSDIEQAFIENRMLFADEKRYRNLLAGVRGSISQAAIPKDGIFTNNIRNFWANVNWKNNKNNFQKTENMEADDTLKKKFEEAFAEKERKESARNNEQDNNIRYSVKETPNVKQDVKKLIDIANEEAPADTNLPNIKPKEAKKGDRESAFPENLKGASIFDERFKDLAVENSSISSYNAIANKDTMQEALLKLDKEGADAVEKFRNKNPKNMSAIDIAMGFILMHRYQAVGNYEGMIAITQKLREAGTAGGQTVQLFSILGRMTPDGMVYYAQKELGKAWDEVVKGKTRQWAEEHKDDYKLTEEEIESIVRDVSFAAQLPNGRDRNILLAGISQLIADKIQKTGGQQLKAWARISMLLNPKTQVRNVLGNAIIMPQHMISDFIGTAIDKQVAKTTNVRTTGTFSKAAFAGMKKGFYESFDDFRRGINTRNMDGDRFEIGQGKIFNDDTAKGRALNALDRTLSFLLDAGDRTFYETWFINSLNNQMRLNKATEPTAHMIEIATQEALQRTWQDENAYTKTVSAIRKAFNAVNIKGYGLGDVIMPFVKTPANLTKALIDFSPIGFINAITRKAVVLKRSIDNGEYTPAMQREFVGAISKGITGTMLMIAYWCLASLGKLTGGEDEDKDVAYFEKNIMGIAPYSFRIGDTSVSYDWMQPLGGTAAMVADVYDAIKDGKYKGIFKGTLGERGKEAANIVWDAAVAAGDVLYDQSFMTGISNLFGYDGFWGGLFGTLTAEPAKFTPTIVSQIASATDDTARTSYVYGDPVQTAINKVLYKMPGARKGLEPIIDQLGRETKNADTVAARAFNSFLNPAIVRSKNSNKAAEEMYRLYEETGDASAIPPVAEYYFNVDKERNIMTAEERTKYQKVFGQEAVKQVNSALDFKPYGKLSDAEKVDVVEDIYSYAKALARAEVSAYELAGNDKKAAEAEAKGIAAATYFIYKATGDLNGNGSINQEEAKKALDKLPLTKAQKAILWQLTNSQWSVKNNPYK